MGKNPVALKVEYTATQEMLNDMACAEYDTRPYGWLRHYCGMVAGFVLVLVACISLWRLFHAWGVDEISPSNSVLDGSPEMVRLLLCLFLIQLLVGFVLLFHRLLSLFWRRRELRSMIGKHFVFNLTPEGIDGDSFGTSLVLPWSFFRIAVIKDKGVLLRYNKLCYWLPQAVLSGDTTEFLQKVLPKS